LDKPVTVEWHQKASEYITISYEDELCAVGIEGDSGGPVQYGDSEWTYVTATDGAANHLGSCAEGARIWGYEIPYTETFIGVHVQT
jgi:hypothetical protein